MLVRFDPIDTFDKVFDRRPSLLAMDAVRNDDSVFVYFDAPGLESDDINITIEKNAVTVEATRRWYDADQKTLTSERPQGVFKRQIQFGDHVEMDDISANLDKGVLTLEVPIKEGTKARTITVETATSGVHELETSHS